MSFYFTIYIIILFLHESNALVGVNPPPGLRVHIRSLLTSGAIITVPLSSIAKRQKKNKKKSMLSFGLRVFNSLSGEFHAQVLETDEINDTAVLLINEQLRLPLSKYNHNSNSAEYINYAMTPQSEILSALPRMHKNDGTGIMSASTLSIIFCPCKSMSRLRNMIDGCVALGVSQFIPVTSANSKTADIHSNSDLMMINLWIVDAMQQSERLTPMPEYTVTAAWPTPDVQPGLLRSNSVLDVLTRLLEADSSRDNNKSHYKNQKRVFVAVEPRLSHHQGDADKPGGTGALYKSFTDVMQQLRVHSDDKTTTSDYLVVGPEGGWHCDELRRMLALGSSGASSRSSSAAGTGEFITDEDVSVIAVSLGSGVMRAELAAVVGSGVWNCCQS